MKKHTFRALLLPGILVDLRERHCPGPPRESVCE